jgi:hypothetical protein
MGDFTTSMTLTCCAVEGTEVDVTEEGTEEALM